MVRNSLCGGWSGRSATQQLLGGPGVGLGDLDRAALLAVLLTAAGGRRRGERSTGLASGLQPAQLAGPGHLEPLLGAGVRLVLRHRFLFLLRTSCGRGGASLRRASWRLSALSESPKSG